MVAEATISRSHFGTDLADLHKDLLESAGLPQTSPGIDAEVALGAMSRDKKRSGTNGSGCTGHRFVLLKDVGQPVYGVNVDDAEARRAIEAVVG
jgi:3-dehydroquinate synthetase